MKYVSLPEMRGLFVNSDGHFQVEHCQNGFVLTLSNVGLLVTRREIRYFKTSDATIAFVLRHFCIPCDKRAIISFYLTVD